MFFAAEKLPERPGGSQSIDKWFSTDHDFKSVNNLADLSAKPEASSTSGGTSGSIWGDFECDSIPDAVLLKAADAVEQREIKTEQSQPDSGLHFPGRGQKLGEASNTSIPLGSIVRRIPGIGVITGRSVIDDSKPQGKPFNKLSVNAAVTNLSQHQPCSNISSTVLIHKDDSAVGNQTASSASSVKFESVAEFRKTVGMVMSPSGTEVRVKNFVSVCNRNARSLPKRNVPLDVHRLKSERSVSSIDDAEKAVRPVKKMRFDTEPALSNTTVSGNSKNCSSNTHPNSLALQLDKSISIAGDDDVIMVNSDSESKGLEDSEQRCQTVGEELNACKAPQTAPGILPVEASVDEAGVSDTDQAVGGIDISQVFEQTSYVECPVCQISVPADTINEHLDQCLTYM